MVDGSGIAQGPGSAGLVLPTPGLAPSLSATHARANATSKPSSSTTSGSSAGAIGAASSSSSASLRPADSIPLLTDTAALTRASRAFSFPYPQAYAIQIQLMQAVFRAIEDGQVGIFESPTGTGKSLSLICAAFTWLEQNAQRSTLAGTDPGSSSNEDVSAKSAAEDDEPDWVLAHARAQQVDAAARAEAELRARVRAARKAQASFKRRREQDRRLAGGSGAGGSGAGAGTGTGTGTGSGAHASAASFAQRAKSKGKRSVASGSKDEDDDEQFLLRDEPDSAPARRDAKSKEDSGGAHGELAAFLGVLKEEDAVKAAGAGGSSADGGGDDLGLSAEVRALMAQFDAQSSAASSRGFGGLASSSSAVAARFASGGASAAQAAQIEELLAAQTRPQLFYASRTHSQLSQFVAELRKTRFADAREDDQNDKGKQGSSLRRSDSAIALASDSSTNSSAQSTARKRAHMHISPGASDDEDDTEGAAPARVIALGSRKQMCINEAVQAVGREKGSEAMNERCKELLKGKGGASASSDKDAKQDPKKEDKRCPFAPGLDQGGLEQALEFRDHAFTEVRDIEDLTALGRSLNTCPYFASRLAAKQAQLVTLPYNLLLHADSRAAAEVDVKDGVVLIDEAHNLIDTILAAHTVSMTLAQVEQALAQITTYLDKFALRLRGSNEMHLRQMQRALKSLKAYAAKWAAAAKGAAKEEIMAASSFVGKLEGTLDQVNLAQLDLFLRDSQIARKVAGYADKQAERERAQNKDATALEQRNSINSMRAISSFLLSLVNADRDGKVLLSVLPAKPPAAAPTVIIKYQLLNPAHSFATLVEQARAIVLAGGTMEPVSDLITQVLPQVAPAKIARLSCGHVIPSSNLFAAVVSTGPRKGKLEFKYESRSDQALMDELGAALSNFANITPDGLVVFVPSYKVLHALMERWRATKQLDSMTRRKKLFVEPQTAAEVETVLRNYTAAIEQPAAGFTGAILVAVVGAKLSEGINFSNRLARAVVMVGLPFPNAGSAELIERMRFARELASRQPQASGEAGKKDAGQELYVNMCMKAVNQSIGRAIRHRNDYAALLLVDARFAPGDIAGKLPGWIRNEVRRDLSFPHVMRDLGIFFRGKRTVA